MFRERAPADLLAGINRLLALRQPLLEQFAPLRLAGVGGLRTRHHGNYHLGQVLVAQNDFIITDFEGAPDRPLAERRGKHSPLRDVASMLRCFSYVAATAIDRATAERPADRRRLGPLVRGWESATSAAFLTGYRGAVEHGPACVDGQDSLNRLVAFFTLEKALDELLGEMDYRPEGLSVPLYGLLRTLDLPGDSS
jgi:maltose alpha-D-glucosyltransferase/alpha-amylase